MTNSEQSLIDSAAEAIWKRYCEISNANKAESWQEFQMIYDIQASSFKEYAKAALSVRQCEISVGLTVADIEDAIKTAQPERIIVRQELRQRDNNPIEVLHEQIEFRVTAAQQALSVMELINGRAPKPVSVSLEQNLQSMQQTNEQLIKRLKIAIGGLRSVAHGDARTWPKEDARLVAEQTLKDCGGDKYVD